MTNTLLLQDNKFRVIIDTNLWISFLIGHQLNRLLDIVTDSRCELITTPLLTTEIATVTLREKFRKYFPVEMALDLLSWLDDNAVSVDLGFIPERCRDPKDDYLLELAVQSKAIYLVSGDSDLLEIGEIEGCRIMTVAQFEEEWMNSI